MNFNILGGIFGFGKESKHVNNSLESSTPEIQRTPAQQGYIATPPTFIQQLTKGAFMLGGVMGVGYVLDTLSELISHQDASDPILPLAPDATILPVQPMNVVMDYTVSIQNPIINYSFLTPIIEKADLLIEQLANTPIPTYAVGLMSICSGFPTLQLAGIALISSSLKFTGVRAEQPNITFLTTIGGSGNELGALVQPTQDGGFIVASSTNSFGGGGD